MGAAPVIMFLETTKLRDEDERWIKDEARAKKWRQGKNKAERVEDTKG